MPKGIEIERKYIIMKPEVEQLCAFFGYTVSEIIQTYLTSSDGSTRRVRKRDFGDHISYTETRKIRIDKISSEEREREISEEEYISMLAEKRSDSAPVRKTRHTFVYMGHTVEIDIYPQWKNTCIMETELENREETVIYPDLIKIVREVTGDKRYSNAAMAREFPEETV